MSNSSRHVVVIGGGVIGTACAYYLLKSGWKVTVVEKGTFGGGSSHGNCGLVCPSHVLPMAEPGMVAKGLATLFQKNSPLAIKFRMDPALWSWLVHFALRCNRRDMMEAGKGIQALLESSLELYGELIDRESLSCEWQKKGLLFAYRSPQEMDAYAATDRLLAGSFHCPARRFDGDAVTELEPALKPGLAGGWYYEDDAHLRPETLMRSWRALLAAGGAEIRENNGLRRIPPSERQGARRTHGRRGTGGRRLRRRHRCLDAHAQPRAWRQGSHPAGQGLQPHHAQAVHLPEPAHHLSRDPRRRHPVPDRLPDWLDDGVLRL